MTKARAKAERGRTRISQQAEQQKPVANIAPVRDVSSALERRAIDAAIWGMPLVGTDSLRQAFFRAGGIYGDIAFSSTPSDWRFQVKTADASSIQVYFAYNLKSGPWLLEIPASEHGELYGSINDAWQVPLADVGARGSDAGQGGRYIILPAEYADELPRGCLPVWSPTNNGYGLLRVALPTDSSDALEHALALVRQLRLSPLSKEGHPIRVEHDEPDEQVFLDLAGVAFDAAVPTDERFFEGLARMIRDERVEPRDLAMMGYLRMLGIEPASERSFAPDADLQRVLRSAAAAAHATLVDAFTRLEPYWPNLAWGILAAERAGRETRYTFEHRDWLDVDARGTFFFGRCAPSTLTDEVILELTVASDATGAPLDGSTSYTLRVPAQVPADSGWALTVYDLETAAFHRDVVRVAVSSRNPLLVDSDGSVTIVIGPNAPGHDRGNWIPTIAGRRWFGSFRFFDPGPSIRDRTWVLPNLEALAPSIAAPARPKRQRGSRGPSEIHVAL